VLNFLDTYKLIKGQAAFGVELIYNTKENFTLIVIELISNKGGIEVSNKYIDITLEELAKKNTKNRPVYFSIGGKGVIHKKVKAEDHVQGQELLNQVLPNASIKDFYLQKVKIEGFEWWVSVVRRDVVDKLIKQVERLKLFGIQMYLGPFVLENTIPLLDKMSVSTTSHELIMEKNSIIQMDSLGSVSNGEEYNIEGEIINSHELIAFGTAFSHFVPPTKIVAISSKKIEETKEEYLHKNKLLAVGLSMISLFFIVVMINLVVANAYEKTHNELQFKVNSKKKYVVELANLNEELKIKEQFVQNSGVARASRISFYADQIALSVSKAIQLDQLFINPLEKRITKAEDINFNYNNIKITGTVSRSIELNNWVKVLKQYDWVADIDIISFIQDNFKTAGEFEIEVTIK
jgi:hypothetical protein